MEHLSSMDHLQENLCKEGEDHVTFCYDSQAFHVSYRGILLQLYKPALESMIARLQAEYQRHKGRIEPGRRGIEIPTPDRNVRILVSLYDIKRLLPMMRKAYWIFETKYWRGCLN